MGLKCPSCGATGTTGEQFEMVDATTRRCEDCGLVASHKGLSYIHSE